MGITPGEGSPGVFSFVAWREHGLSVPFSETGQGVSKPRPWFLILEEPCRSEYLNAERRT